MSLDILHVTTMFLQEGVCGMQSLDKSNLMKRAKIHNAVAQYVSLPALILSVVLGIADAATGNSSNLLYDFILIILNLVGYVSNFTIRDSYLAAIDQIEAEERLVRIKDLNPKG
jgi:hypothetical protein